MRAGLHVVLEWIGALAFLVVQCVLVLLWELGANLRGVNTTVFFAAIALGYAAMIGLFLAQRSRIELGSTRLLVDLWLAAFVPAAILTLALVGLEWPFGFPTGGGHGLASGGEANAALFPWLQLGFFLGLGRWWLS